MKKIIIMLALTFAFLTILSAQALKIAYIDSDKILKECKDTKEAMTLFQKDREGWEKQVNDLDAEVKRLEGDYTTKKLTLSAQGKKQAEDKIEQKKAEKKQLIESIFGENGRAAQRNAELIQPIMTKLKAVIERISVEDNYSIVLDSQNIIWAKPTLDISERIITEMNKTE